MKRWVNYLPGPLVENTELEKNCSGNIPSVGRDKTCGEHQWLILAVRAQERFRTEVALELDEKKLVKGHSRQSEDNIAQVLR